MKIKKVNFEIEEVKNIYEVETSTIRKEIELVLKIQYDDGGIASLHPKLIKFQGIRDYTLYEWKWDKPIAEYMNNDDALTIEQGVIARVHAKPVLGPTIS